MLEYEKKVKFDTKRKSDDVTDNKEEIYKNFKKEGGENQSSISKKKEEQDNISTTGSRPREDSIMLEARDNMNSPSDMEGGRVSKFFKSNKEEGSLEEEKVADIEIPKGTDREKFRHILDLGSQHRQKANSLFKKNKFREALSEYLKAINELNSLLLSNRSTEILNMTSINWTRMECLKSIAVCYLLLKDYANVLQYTQEVLAINPNNFIALSYRAKALMALNLYEEALSNIKQALSIKYSKTLMNLLKEIEDKLNITEKRKLLEDANEIHIVGNKNQTNLDAYTNKDKNNSQKDGQGDKKSFPYSILITILKFVKILSIGVFDFIKRRKLGLLILIILWIIAFRTRFKNKLLNLLRIKFN
jgi:tetratricopeptide (TPR) repeat protein